MPLHPLLLPLSSHIYRVGFRRIVLTNTITRFTSINVSQISHSNLVGYLHTSTFKHPTQPAFLSLSLSQCPVIFFHIYMALLLYIVLIARRSRLIILHIALIFLRIYLIFSPHLWQFHFKSDYAALTLT